MNFLRRKFEGSPDYARVVPFVIFVVLTALQGRLGEDSRYWLYLLKTLVGAWLIWEMRPYVEEMRWKISWEALVVGAGIFGIWVGLDGLYPRLSEAGCGLESGQAVRGRLRPDVVVRGGAHRRIIRRRAAAGGGLLPFLPLSDVCED